MRNVSKLGGDLRQQETARFWDSGIRLKPSGQAVYLGMVSSEVLLQKLRVYSYWSAVPSSQQNVAKLAVRCDLDLCANSAGRPALAEQRQRRHGRNQQ